MSIMYNLSTCNTLKERYEFMANLQDIANKTGVSVATVSRILNNDPTFRVAESTRTNVLATAEHLSYVKNSGSVGEKTVPSPEISVKTSFFGIVQMFSKEKIITDPYYTSLERELELLQTKNHFKLIPMKKQVNGSFTTDFTQKLDGIFAIGIFSQQEIQQLEKFSKKIIFLDSTPENENHTCILPHFFQGLSLGLKYLIKSGHTNIGFIGESYVLNQETSHILEPRRLYFEGILRPYSLYQDNLVLSCENTVVSAYEKISSFLETAPNFPTALVIASDCCASGVIRGIVEKGLRIPEDISLIAFNNSILSQYAMVPLTAISVPQGQMAQLAVEEMVKFQLQKDDTLFPKVILVPCSFVIRESVKIILDSP